MKSGTLAQVHRKGIKAGSRDPCFKDTELCSKGIRLWTSIDDILKDVDDGCDECLIVDHATCGGNENAPAHLRMFSDLLAIIYTVRVNCFRL